MIIIIITISVGRHAYIDVLILIVRQTEYHKDNRKMFRAAVECHLLAFSIRRCFLLSMEARYCVANRDDVESYLSFSLCSSLSKLL